MLDWGLHKLVLHAIVAEAATPGIEGDSKIRILVAEVGGIGRLQRTDWGLGLELKNTQIEDELVAGFGVVVSVSAQPVTPRKAYRGQLPVSAATGAELGLRRQWSWQPWRAGGHLLGEEVAAGNCVVKYGEAVGGVESNVRPQDGARPAAAVAAGQVAGKGCIVATRPKGQ